MAGKAKKVFIADKPMAFEVETSKGEKVCFVRIQDRTGDQNTWGVIALGATQNDSFSKALEKGRIGIDDSAPIKPIEGQKIPEYELRPNGGKR